MIYDGMISNVVDNGKYVTVLFRGGIIKVSVDTLSIKKVWKNKGMFIGSIIEYSFTKYHKNSMPKNPKFLRFKEME